MASADVDMRIHEEEESQRQGRREPPPPPRLIQYYKASEIIPEERGQLHGLLQKQPAVLGSLQVVSGILSVSVGILFAVTQNMEQSFFTMFRVSHLTGALYIIAGLVSNLLFKYPSLVAVSLVVNCGCIIVAVIGAVLISIDLAQWKSGNELEGMQLEGMQLEVMQLEVMQLCVLGLEVLLSAVLCFWFFKEKPSKSL